MLTSKERWILTAAWAAILAVGVGSLLVIQARSEATMATILAQAPVPPTPPPLVPCSNLTMERFLKTQQVITSVRTPSTDYVACMVPEIKLVPIPPKPPVELVPPVALYSGKFEMDRATVRWTLREATPDPNAKYKQARSAPKAIVVHRLCDTGEVAEVALLDPKATSFEDRDVQPNHSYRYWVFVRAEKGLTDRTGHAPLIDEGGEGSADGVVPAWHKVRLIGGDRDHAILMVESYQPAAGRWESKRLMATPGQPIGKSGWTLEGLKFDRSTLVAEVKDDLRETRVLSTKEK